MNKRSQNSLVLASLQELASNLFCDFELQHPHLKKQITLDKRTLMKRSAKEGISFLTSSLPTLSKALLRGLETGVFLCPQGFRKLKGTELPRFLGGFLKEVFHEDGTIRIVPSPLFIADIQQLCLMFNKIDLPCHPKKVQKVVDNFVDVERELAGLVIEENDVLNVARSILTESLSGFDPKEILPRHGPGAVATGDKCEEKWVFKRHYKAIHRFYPMYEYYWPSWSSILTQVGAYKSMEVSESGVAKVVLVPKDSRGPRLISMEPLEYQFIQQGLAKSLVNWIETKRSVLRGRVNFVSQETNRNLAEWNSVTRRYATLDLKEASDRVSLQLVESLFKDLPELLEALKATRTTATLLPNGVTLPLVKFAPMGSALCFPIEALTFFALAEALRRKACIEGTTYVYGDDLVVPKEVAALIFEEFPKYGIKLNEDKCFIRGFFRESCGMDSFKGNTCTPTRIRKPLPSSRRDSSSIVSAVELSNALFSRGYWRSASYVQQCVEKHCCIAVLRSVRVNTGALSYTSFTQKGIVVQQGSLRYNKPKGEVERCGAKGPFCWIAEGGTNRFYYQALVSTQKSRRSTLDGEGRLLSNLVSQRQENYVVPHATVIKKRWIPIFG